MNIQTISKEKKEVMIELTADDLGIICNALYAQLGEKKHNDTIMQLYSDMMMARDLCRYGHVDDFCLHNIVKCRTDCSQRLKSWGSQNLMENNIHLDMFRLRTNLRN